MYSFALKNMLVNLISCNHLINSHLSPGHENMLLRVTIKRLRTKGYVSKTRLFEYIETFTTKSRKFSDKKSDLFHISAQNIDCGYSLEPPQSVCLGKVRKIIYPCKPQFYYINVGFKGIKIIWACFRDGFSKKITHKCLPPLSLRVTLQGSYLLLLKV